MSKAEEIHYKAVMAADNQEPPKDYCISARADHFNGFVEGFVEGYHQAEKDLELTWKDFEIIHKITYDESRNVSLNKGGEISKKEFYQEVLNRFNKYKER